MKTSISLILSLVASSMAQVVCIQAITTTIAYLPALTLGANSSCPTANSISYYSVDGADGCCTAAATAVALASTKGLACCPCGALCTGYMPKIQAWTLSGDNLSITGPAPVTTKSATSTTSTASTTTSTTTTATSASLTSNQLVGSTTTISPSSSIPSTSSATSTGASPTTSSGAGGGRGKFLDLLSGLGFVMGAFWMA